LSGSVIFTQPVPLQLGHLGGFGGIGPGLMSLAAITSPQPLHSGQTFSVTIIGSSLPNVPILAGGDAIENSHQERDLSNSRYWRKRAERLRRVAAETIEPESKQASDRYEHLAQRADERAEEDQVRGR
jgi:hypothetical protein